MRCRRLHPWQAHQTAIHSARHALHKPSQTRDTDHGRTTSLHTSYPIVNWCQLTEQCNLTLNMMRPCRQNPALSAFEAMEGLYSFDATPMAPPGTKVLLVHHKPSRCRTWGYHAMSGWYVVPALHHYRCIKTIMVHTEGERITNTFKFNHNALPMPSITQADYIVDAAHRLSSAIAVSQTAPPDELKAIASIR
jgi:hypothetical protein